MKLKSKLSFIVYYPMKNISIAVLLALAPLSATAWDIPGVVKQTTYDKVKNERDDAQKMVSILAAIVGVLAMGLFLKLIYSAFSFFIKRDRNRLKRK